jgi:hypothetical protein
MAATLIGPRLKQDPIHDMITGAQPLQVFGPYTIFEVGAKGKDWKVLYVDLQSEHTTAAGEVLPAIERRYLGSYLSVDAALDAALESWQTIAADEYHQECADAKRCFNPNHATPSGYHVPESDLVTAMRGLILVAEQALEREPLMSFSDRVDLHEAIKGGQDALRTLRANR